MYYFLNLKSLNIIIKLGSPKNFLVVQREIDLANFTVQLVYVFYNTLWIQCNKTEMSDIKEISNEKLQFEQSQALVMAYIYKMFVYIGMMH